MNEQSPVITANVGRDVLRTLRNYGVDTIFGIPGTHNLEFYRHLDALGIHPVTTRHEQGAVFGADGWSMQTGLPGVVITTSGPGLLNALSGIANAYAESRPLIVLTPGPPVGQEFADIGSLHESKDTVGAAGAVAEWSGRVRSGTEAVAAVHDAFALFRAKRPRPVVIEIPLDVLEGESDCSAESLAVRPEPKRLIPDADALAAAVTLLDHAERPVILAGGGSTAAAEHLRELAESLDAPVITTLNGRGVVPESHPLAVGASLRLKSGHALVNEADVLLVIGSKIGEAELWWGALEPVGEVIRVDRLDSQLTKNLPNAVGIQGDSVDVTPALARGVTPRNRDGAARAKTAREAIDRESREWHPPITSFCDDLAAALPADVIVGADSSQSSYYGTANHVVIESPNSYLYMATYATLGYGLPAAIGAKIAAPERPVVAVIGDGALMFSVQELMTATQQNLDLVVVCVNNGGYVEIEENERDRGIPPVGVRLDQPDWLQLAEAFGWTSAEAGSRADVTREVESALAAGGRRFIHVPFEIYEAKETSAA